MKVSSNSRTYQPKPHNWLFKLTFSFVTGICVFRIFYFQGLLWIGLAILSLCVFIYFISGNYKGVLGILSFFTLGGVIYTIEYEKNINSYKEYAGLSIIRIERILKTKEKHFQLKGAVLDSLGKPQFRSLIYLDKDHLTDDILPGDILICSAVFTPLEDTKIPFAFSPRKYYFIKGISHQTFLNSSSILRREKEKNFNLIRISRIVNNKMVDAISQWPGNKEEKDVLIALLTGSKDYLGEDTRKVYSDTGIIHVLAVSGLHTGLIYFLVTSIMSILFGSRYPKFQSFFVITSLWLYAFFTGLTPSVIRAATMFSFIDIGVSLRRKTTIYHSISFSALMILTANPFMLFDIGFQLSYSAVFGIVTTADFFNKLMNLSSSYVLKKIGDLLSVSLAAQLFTMPFSLYYFSKFPTYFFITNMYAIPIVTLTLYIGFPLAIISVFIPKISFLGYIPSYLIGVNNYLTKLIQDAPYSSLQGLFITDFQFVLLFIFITLLSLGLVHRSKVYLFLSLFSILIFQLISTVRYFTYRSDLTEISLYFIHSKPLVYLDHGRKYTAVFYNGNNVLKEQISKSIYKYQRSKNLDTSYVQWYTFPDRAQLYHRQADTIDLSFFVCQEMKVKKHSTLEFKHYPDEFILVVIDPRSGCQFLNGDGDRIFIF